MGATAIGRYPSYQSSYLTPRFLLRSDHKVPIFSHVTRARVPGAPLGSGRLRTDNLSEFRAAPSKWWFSHGRAVALRRQGFQGRYLHPRPVPLSDLPPPLPSALWISFPQLSLSGCFLSLWRCFRRLKFNEFYLWLENIKCKKFEDILGF